MNRTATGTGWLVGKVRKGQAWCALLALSLGLSAAEVASSPDLPTVLLAIALAGSAFIFYLGLSLINGWVNGCLGTEDVARETSGILVLSQIALALYLLGLVSGDSMSVAVRSGLHLLSGLLIMALVAKAVAYRNRKGGRTWAIGWELLNDDQLILAGLFLPPVLICLGGPLLGGLNPLAGQPIVVQFLAYVSVLLILAGVHLSLVRQAVGGGGLGSALVLYDFDTAIIVGGAPLVLIPLCFVVANEMQFAVPGTRPVAVAYGLTAMLVIASVVLFLLQRSGRLRFSGAAALSGFYFPATVATLVSIRTHRQTLQLGVLDYLETGQLSLPAQQLADFGRVPLLDVIPTHGLSDAGFQSMFTLVHGARDLDMLVWLPWLPIVIGFLSIYAFLSRTTTPLLALLVTVLLPIRAAVVGAYAIALLPAMALVGALRRPTVKRFLVLWLTLEILWLWRPGLGLAALVSVVVVVCLVVLTEKRQSFTAVAISLGLALLTVPAGLLMAEIFGAGDASAALRSTISKGFALRGGRFGAIAADSSTGDLSFFVQRLLPVVAALCILTFLFQLAVRGVRSSSRGQAVLYLAVFSLVIPASVEATSSGWRLDPSLGLLALALAPLLSLQGALRPRMMGRVSWILATLVFCAFLGLPGEYPLVGAGDEFRFHEWQEGERRVRFDEQSHRDLVDLLRRRLEGEATFFDFTGSPALYPLASKRFPLAEIDNFQETTELSQRSQLVSLERDLEEGRLPLVVFSSPPGRSAKSRDLPRAVTSYRIAEFLYRNYVPFAEVGGWEVWRQQGLQLGRPKRPATVMNPSQVSQHFKLGDLPLGWAKNDPGRSFERSEPQVTLLDRPTAVRPGLPLRLSWTREVDSGDGNYLHVRAKSMQRQGSMTSDLEATHLTIAYGEPRESTFRLTVAPSVFEPRANDRRVVLPLEDDPKANLLHRDSHSPERLLFKATGKDPWVRRFVDFSQAPVIDTVEELWLNLKYRSSADGRGQVFFAVGDRRFSERNSIKVLFGSGREGDAPREVLVPVLGGEDGQALVDLRLDPPAGSVFEIVGVELIRRPREFDDYMIRLSTQWRWSSGDIQQLTLRANAPVLVESVHLRAGD